MRKTYGETQTKDSEENGKLYEADYEVDDEAVVSLGKFIAPDQHASLADKLIFVREHPIQPLNVLHNLMQTEFIADNYQMGIFLHGSGCLTIQKYIKYCVAYVWHFSADRKCPFVSGFMCDKRHLYDRIVKHEKSNLHEAASNFYFRVENRCTVDDLLNKEQESEKETRRQVLERIIPIFFIIGRQGIAYRGKLESAWSIPSDEFENSNCGNFLALVVLISKYDPVLGRHLNEVTEKSKQRHEQGKSSKGRGSLHNVTFQNNSEQVNKYYRIPY